MSGINYQSWVAVFHQNCISLYFMTRIKTCLVTFFSDFDSRFPHTRTIQDHYVFLVDHLDAKHSGLVGELYSAEVLSREELENITSELTSFGQNEKMLSMLSRKTKDQFDKFLDALDQTAQQHVRNHITGRQRLFRSCCFCCFLLVLFILLTLSNVIY